MKHTLPLTLRALILPLALAWTIGPAAAQDTASTAKTTRSTRADPIRSRGKLGQELFLATVQGNLEGVQALLKQGADPNARNGLEFTPLFLASGMAKTKIMEALIDAGAQLDPDSQYGSPLSFACMTGAVPAIQLLLARGAKIDPERPDGITPLMYVARAGLPHIASDLLQRKVDVNAKDVDGATALTYAARQGKLEVARVLLSAGATVDVADNHGRTPLAYAAENGHLGMVNLLLDQHANANARDKKGRTPLLLTITHGDYPDVVSALLKAGADPKATDDKNRSANSLASARGRAECAKLLASSTPSPGGTLHTPKEALQLSVKAIGAGMGEFNRLTSCVSCHHEGLGWATAGVAAEHGFAIPTAVESAYRKRILGELEMMGPACQVALKDPSQMKNLPLIEMGDIPLAFGYVLAAMSANKQPPTEATGAVAMIVGRLQLPDGHWMFGLPRVPMESSNFTMTALAVQALKTYGPKDQAKEIEERIGKAKAWLLATPTQSSEDRAFRLLGLKLAGATEGELKKPLEELRAEQRPDGGWPQLPSLQSDAYATGQALYALHRAGGIPVSDAAYKKGVQFLLRTQEDDGSWFASKRAVPANNYFDAGFPHGESQYASFNATCWATIALAQTVDAPQKSARASK